MKQSRRVSPRIPYEEAVCLTRVDGRGRLFGRSIDLGPSGIYVMCGELCEIGTELVCTVLLPGGPRKLRGRVVRLVALPNAVGVAIAFTELREADRLAVERLVARRLATAEPVKLRVSGLDHDLRCEAVMGEHTMRVTTALPNFLRLENGVGVTRDGQVSPGAQGVISRIAIDPNAVDGVPRLSVEVDIDPEREVDDRARRAPPSALPRTYRPSLPSVLLSEPFANELVADAPSEPTTPPRRRRNTAELARRFVEKLTSVPESVEEDRTRKVTGRTRGAVALEAPHPLALASLLLPLLFAIAVLLLRHPSPWLP